jgi:hypothetical protein
MFTTFCVIYPFHNYSLMMFIRFVLLLLFFRMPTKKLNNNKPKKIGSTPIITLLLTTRYLWLSIQAGFPLAHDLMRHNSTYDHFRYVKLCTLPACSWPPASYSLLMTTHLLIFINASSSLVHERPPASYSLLISYVYLCKLLACSWHPASYLALPSTTHQSCLLIYANFSLAHDIPCQCLSLIWYTYQINDKQPRHISTSDHSLVLFIYASSSLVHGLLRHIPLLLISYVYLCKLPACSWPSASGSVCLWLLWYIYHINDTHVLFLLVTTH